MPLEQRTADWFRARCGKVTASRVSDVTARTKTGWSTSRANYAAQIIAERLTGIPQHPSYTNTSIQWGIDTEPKARAAYEFFSGNLVSLAPFVLHPSIENSGASPDGFVSEDGLLEIKCPNTATHIDTLLGDGIEKKYFLQMQWQMACTGRNWCDFVSFDPRLPVDLQLHIKRVPKDESVIGQLTNDISLFLNEIAEKVVELQQLTQKRAA